MNKDFNITKDGILAESDNNSLIKDVIVFDTIDSTNTYAKTNANSLNDGTLVIANEQTGGRGRLGRTFFSPKNTGIYMSLVIKRTPPREITNLVTVCAAVAVVRALKNVCGAVAKIKWVNDIFIDKYKVCGILTEAGFDPASCKNSYIVTGIGINTVTESFPDEIKEIANSVTPFSKKEFTRNSLIAGVMNEFGKLYNLLLSGNKDSIISEYKEHLFILGKQIGIVGENGIVSAYAKDINSDANLVVVLENGCEKTLIGGEISIKL